MKTIATLYYWNMSMAGIILGIGWGRGAPVLLVIGVVGVAGAIWLYVAAQRRTRPRYRRTGRV